MKLAENIILTDNSVGEMEEFKNAVNKETKENFVVYALNSNKGRSNKIYNLIRYIKYFIFPLMVFLNRNKVKKIIAWQQFYGLIFAFYCRLFNVKKKCFLYINVFIYREKRGFIGKIYQKFMKYIVTSKYIDIMSTTSSAECEMYAKTFGVDINKFIYTPFGINNIEKEVEDIKTDYDDKFILSLGRSNRDWDFLIDSLKETEYKLKIICDELKTKNQYKNIEIINDVYGVESYKYIKQCYCMVMPILDPTISAGQTVLLEAMNLKKPIIITESKGLTDDYITDRINGIVISKEKTELLNSLNELYNNSSLYENISNKAYKDYIDKYSLYALGENVGKIIKKYM